MKITDWIASATLDELKRGYVEQDEQYICLCCGLTVEKGIVYPADGKLYEAIKYTKLHIEQEHGSAFQFLAAQDKSITGLTDIQRNLLELFYQGKSDLEVQQALGTGSTSTIRNHRFVLKEKERQAKVFLAMMELLREKDKHTPASSGGNRAGRVNKGADATAAEHEKVIGKYFTDGAESPLKSFPTKEKHKRIVLGEIVKYFETKRNYSEKEVNAILEEVFEDYAVIRRNLIDYGFMNRVEDGSRYWLNDENGKEAGGVSRREELKQQAKEIKTQAGVYQIRNTVTGKIFIEANRNLKSVNGQLFTLEMGSHAIKSLQQDWKEYGKDAFVVEVLEELKKDNKSEFYDEKDALKKLKDKWLDKLQPYGDKGYNDLKK